MCDRLDVNSARVSVTFDSKAGLQNEHCSNTVEVAAISQECSKWTWSLQGLRQVQMSAKFPLWLLTLSRVCVLVHTKIVKCPYSLGWACPSPGAGKWHVSYFPTFCITLKLNEGSYSTSTWFCITEQESNSVLVLYGDTCFEVANQRASTLPSNVDARGKEFKNEKRWSCENDNFRTSLSIRAICLLFYLQSNTILAWIIWKPRLYGINIKNKGLHFSLITTDRTFKPKDKRYN